MVIKNEYEGMKQINIPFAAGQEQKVFPVFYAIENKAEECIQIIRCSVGLPTHQVPKWLNPQQFVLVSHVRDGIQLVDYNATEGIDKSTLEADAFCYKVFTEIFFRERSRLLSGIASC